MEQEQQEATPEPASETRPSSGTRGYVVLMVTTPDDLDAGPGDPGARFEMVRRGPFATVQAALDAAADALPRSGEDHEPRTFVAVPTSYFSPKTELTVTKRERVWS